MHGVHNNETYEQFIERHRPKKTTDNCYTPPDIYDQIVEYCKRLKWYNGEQIVRPFYPGGDYENAEYPEGSIVLDNPPFSILSKIVKFYNDNNIKYILFAPALTCMSYIKYGSIAFLVNDVMYENGAKVKTALLTNIEKGKIYTAQLPIKVSKSRAPAEIPDDWITAGRLFKAGRLYDRELDVNDYEFVRKNPQGRKLYGGALKK